MGESETVPGVLTQSLSMDSIADSQQQAVLSRLLLGVEHLPSVSDSVLNNGCQSLGPCGYCQ